MDILFDSLHIFLQVVSFVVSFIFYKKFKHIENTINIHTPLINTVVENTVKMNDEIVQLSDQIDRSMLDLRSILEPTKPMKTNNWVSMRKAFKGPAGVELDE